MSAIKSIRQALSELSSGELVLEWVQNMYGTHKINKSLRKQERKYFEEGINCPNSSNYGLGSCQCVSHSASYCERITKKRAIEMIKVLIKEGAITRRSNQNWVGKE